MILNDKIFMELKEFLFLSVQSISQSLFEVLTNVSKNFSNFFLKSSKFLATLVFVFVNFWMYPKQNLFHLEKFHMKSEKLYPRNQK